ncbi:unnamed protein product [Arctia plantaginis]|uniref:unspecific monooxygenase n=1 Tax=Arctia plantaginis TaxID=874455 RepID=A0A8S1A3M2_ARCPL|nr:unnamed protein product [Arctia plantaginis]
MKEEVDRLFQSLAIGTKQRLHLYKQIINRDRMIVIIWIVVVLVALGLYLRKVYSKLANEGVNHLPCIPFFGNFFWALIKLENFTDFLSKLSATFPDDKVVGMYETLNPVYIVNDVDVIKNITIKDFDHFVDRRDFASELDPTFGRSLINLKGEEWKEMRSTLSPAFTSSKIRLMVPFMVDVGEEMLKVLSKRIKDSESQYIDMSTKDLTTRYANDVIASCAFGLKVDSQSADSHFYVKAKEIVKFDITRLMKMLFLRCLPSIADMLKLTLTSSETSDFFSNVVLSTIEEREKRNIIRHDMINILNEIKKGKLRHEKDTDVDSGAEWKDNDLVAQAVLFLLAGFDTVSTAMTFIIHELAVNPDVQEKLVQEIKEFDQKNGGQLDFKSIQSMKYMDMVVSEGMRLHPPAPFLDRKCVKDYNFGRVNKTATKDLIIRKGAAIGLPIYIFQRNPQLFPNPEKFDPERFSDENKHNIKPFSYMPFGLGPRNCIGSRFALCEVKVMLYQLLLKIKVSPCEKTTIPLELDKGFTMTIHNGAWLSTGTNVFFLIRSLYKQIINRDRMIVIIWIVVVLVALGLYLRKVYSKLANEEVNHLPCIPFFGNLFWAFIKLENITDFMSKLSATFPDDKVVGMYETLNPVYIVKDVDMIKKVTIKDFDHFVDRRSFASEFDSTFGRSLINLKGEEWKEMRSTLSPAFTSSKIRLMVPFMVDVGEEMIKVLSKRIKDSETQYIDVSAKDLTTRYANDVIASCAFGLKVDSQSADSHFYVKAKDIVKFDFTRLMKIFFLRCLPSIADMLKLSLTSSETSGFFSNVVLSSIEEREKRNIIRHDMINILNEIKKGKLSHEKDTDVDSGAGFATVEESHIGKKLREREWSDDDLVAQAVLFLLAGFDTISTAMTFIIHELAVNPDVQEKLVEEIKEFDQKNGGQLDFKSIQSMKYMDMVVSEGMRMHPPAPFLDRICVKDYNFGRVNKTATKDLIVRKGAAIGFPIYIFHRDPQLFPNPQKFDPERFSDENKHNIKPFSYMPFGLGPRNCIGSRFALCEVKVMLYQLLRKIKVSPCEKTRIPLELAKGFLMNVQNGAWVRLELREYD